MTDLDTEPHTERTRRIGQGLALMIAPWAFVIANTGDVLTTEPGLDDTTPRGALLIAALHPLADKWFTFAAMIGCLLLVPAVLGAMGLVRLQAARLGLIGGVLMITGYICYFAMLFQGYATIALAQHGGASADNVAVQDLMMNQGFFIGVALTFVVGNLIGTFLLGLALLRARVVPRWAAVFVLAWPVAHVLGGPWGEVLGAAVEAAGLAVVGLTVLRAASAGSPSAGSEGRDVASAAADMPTSHSATRPAMHIASDSAATTPIARAGRRWSRPPTAILYRSILGAVVLCCCATWGTGTVSAAATSRAPHQPTTLPVDAADGHHDRGSTGARPLVWVRFDPAVDSAGLVVGGVDGSGQRQLTHPGPGLRDSDPVRSPDGRRVIFNREHPDGTNQIAIVNVAGGPVRFVDTDCHDPCFADVNPAWMPDSDHLTFTRVVGPFDPVTGDAASALQYSERLDGSDPQLLSVPGSYEDNTARFAPDGRYAVFTRDQTVNGVLHFAIFLRRAGSTDVRRLTPWDLNADRPSVSPARSGPTAGLISFETHGGGHPTQGDVALLPSSCPTIRRCTAATRFVTHNMGTAKTSYAASWSPSGRRLAFAQEDGTGNVDIFTIRPDGRDRAQVTHSPVPEYSPAWSQ